MVNNTLLSKIQIKKMYVFTYNKNVQIIEITNKCVTTYNYIYSFIYI